MYKSLQHVVQTINTHLHNSTTIYETIRNFANTNINMQKIYTTSQFLQNTRVSSKVYNVLYNSTQLFKTYKTCHNFTTLQNLHTKLYTSLHNSQNLTTFSTTSQANFTNTLHNFTNQLGRTHNNLKKFSSLYTTSRNSTTLLKQLYTHLHNIEKHKKAFTKPTICATLYTTLHTNKCFTHQQNKQCKTLHSSTQLYVFIKQKHYTTLLHYT